jgi:hypothetical protein
LESSWNIPIESRLIFTIWSLELKVMPKKWLEVRLITWLLTIKTQKTWVKWPLTGMCNTWKVFIKGLEVCNLNLFNWNSYYGIMSLQICEIHDLRIFKPQLGSPTSFSHFNVASITDHRVFFPLFSLLSFWGVFSIS